MVQAIGNREHIREENGGLGTEAFAEFTDSHAANEKSRDILKKFLPKASEVYSRMIKEAVSRMEVN